MIAAFDVTTDNPYFSRKFYRAALDQGALIRPIGNTVYWMPPYVVSDEEIDFLKKTTLKALENSLSALH
jgi:adenosylmethionine-8-amino-7-oxononanoate aminotransferase